MRGSRQREGGGGFSRLHSPSTSSLVCDMKGRDPTHLSRCFEQCIIMNSRQGMHVTVSANHNIIN